MKQYFLWRVMLQRHGWAANGAWVKTSRAWKPWNEDFWRYHFFDAFRSASSFHDQSLHIQRWNESHFRSEFLHLIVAIWSYSVLIVFQCIQLRFWPNWSLQYSFTTSVSESRESDVYLLAEMFAVRHEMHRLTRDIDSFRTSGMDTELNYIENGVINSHSTKFPFKIGINISRVIFSWNTSVFNRAVSHYYGRTSCFAILVTFQQLSYNFNNSGDSENFILRITCLKYEMLSTQPGIVKIISLNHHCNNSFIL